MGAKPGGLPLDTMSTSSALSALELFASNLTCSLCTRIFKSPFTFKECGHTFCRECVVSELKKKCLCPTCMVPVQVKGLHKNLTFSTLVACVSKLKDLLEVRSSEEAARELLQSTQMSTAIEETQLPDGMIQDKVLDLLNSVADLSSSESECQDRGTENVEPPNKVQALSKIEGKEPNIIKSAPVEDDPIPQMSEPPKKTMARKSGKATPKTTPSANVKARMKTPASAPVERVKKEVTPPTNTSGDKHIVILMSGLKPDDKALITDYCKDVQKSVKVQIASEYDPKTANRIIVHADDSGLCTRTTKYLRGILDGKSIVTLTWFLDSLAQNAWQQPEAYLVKGDTSIGKETCAVQKAIYSQAKLFDGYTFYLAGRFGSPSKQDLTALLKAGGAKVVVTRPKNQDVLPPNHIIIYDPDQLDDASLWIMSYNPRTSGLWVLDCISSFEILPTY